MEERRWEQQERKMREAGILNFCKKRSGGSLRWVTVDGKENSNFVVISGYVKQKK